jgi:hypothetical protein
MLAPFVLDLLIACTLLLLAGWANDVIVRWISVARHAGSPAAPLAFDRRRRIDRDGFTVGEIYGMSGDWQFKLNHRERG